MTIKNFSDLVFNDHPNTPDAVMATLDLGNNLEISIVSMKNKEQEFGGLYGSVTAGTYEVASFHHNNMLPLGTCDDVIGWQTEAEITELMGNLQGDPKDIHAFIEQMHLARSDARSDLMLD